ncbi:MAG: DMT family transporter [Planctomycetota bacterium]|nr:DMT family transporter [Planctomycetota bacterium]
MDPLKRGRLLICGAAVCWSSAGPLVKYANQALDNWQITGGRSFFALLFMLAVVRPWRGPRWWRPSLKVALLALAYALMLIGYITALVYTTAANAIFLQDTAPIWVMLLSPLLLKEPFRPRDLVLVALCAAGMSLFFLDELGAGQAFGNTMAACSGVGYALVVIGLRWGRAKDEEPPPRPFPERDSAAPPRRGGLHAGTRAPSDAELLVIWGNLFCFLICACFAKPLPPAAELPVPLATIFVLGIVQLGLGYYLMMQGIRHVPALEASLLALLEPVLNPLWTFLFIGERPGPWALLGGGIILGSIVMQSLRAPKAPH